MKSQLSVPLAAFLLLSLFSTFQALTFTGYAIRDLENDDSDFAFEADLWTTSIAITGLPYTVCSGTYLLGGYKVLGNIGVSAQGQYFERIYTQLPTHQMVYFTFTLWALDAWNGPIGDFFQLQFDTRIFNGWAFNELNFPNTNLCGVSSERDLAAVRIFGRTYHSDTALTFRIISQLNQWPGHESFGIRDLNLLFVNTPVQTIESICGLAPITLDVAQCTCPEGYYENPIGSGICAACHSNCKSCFGPDAQSCYECASDVYFTGVTCLKCHEFCATCQGETIDQCLSCKSGMFTINGIASQCTDQCDYPLTATYTGTTANCASTPCTGTQFIDWTATCQPSCNFPLQQNIISSLRECIYPCDPGQYLYWNGSCLPTCQLPVFQSSGTPTSRRCDPVCLTSGHYVYWDGTCSANCDPPLVQQVQGTYQFCTYPCTDVEYLYPNGTCLSTCPYPLSASETQGKQYCNSPCTSTQYLAWNSACINQCDFPLRLTIEDVAQFCLSPCDNTAEYYYEDTGECAAECDGLTVVDEQTLFLKCLNSDDPRSEEQTFLLNLLGSPSGPGTVTLFAVPSMLTYVRYLNINIPPRLDAVLQGQGRSPLSLRLPQTLPSSVKASLTLHDIPSVFIKRGLYSSFLINFWQEFTTWCVALVCIIVFTLLELLFIKLKLRIIQCICERCRVILGWSFLLILIGTGLADLFLSAWLEVTTVDLDSILAVTSFLMCVIITVLTAVFLFKTFHLIAEIYKAKTVAQSKKDSEEYVKCVLPWQNYQVIYRGLDNNSLPNRIFFYIYMARLLLPMAIASCFYYVPLLQTILYVCINLAIIIYLVKMRPIKKLINLVQLLVLETISFMINIFFLSLTILDIENSTDEPNIVLLGDLVILGFDAIGIHLAGFFIAKIVLAFRDSYQLRKEQPKIAKDILFNILFLPLQQGGMGFESANINRPQLSKDDSANSAPNNFFRWEEPPKKLKIQLDGSEITRYFRGGEDEIELFAHVTKHQEDMSSLDKVKVLTLGDEQSNRRKRQFFEPVVVDRTRIKVPEVDHDKSQDLAVNNDNSMQTQLEPFELEPGSTFRSDRQFLRGLSDTERLNRSPSFREETTAGISHHYEAEQRRNRPEVERNYIDGGLSSFLPKGKLY